MLAVFLKLTRIFGVKGLKKLLLSTTNCCLMPVFQRIPMTIHINLISQKLDSLLIIFFC